MRNLVIGVIALLFIVLGGFYIQKYKSTATTTNEVGKVKWDIQNAKINERVTSTFQIYDGNDNEILGVNDRISAIITDKQLSTIQHITPQFAGKGMYKISYELKKEGEYTVFLYEDNGKTTKQFAKKSFTVGEKGAEKEKVLAADTVLTKDIGGYQTSLLFRTLYSNEAATLTFQFQTEKREDLRLRSNADEHSFLYIVDDKKNHFLYAVPISEEGQLQYYITFPSEGVYKVWGTFYIDGKKYEKVYKLQVRERKES